MRAGVCVRWMDLQAEGQRRRARAGRGGSPHGDSATIVEDKMLKVKVLSTGCRSIGAMEMGMIMERPTLCGLT